MSGGLESKDLKEYGTPAMVTDVMKRFNVSDQVARDIIQWANGIALEKHEQWQKKLDHYKEVKKPCEKETL